jgi:hypothetical protein
MRKQYLFADFGLYPAVRRAMIQCLLSDLAPCPHLNNYALSQLPLSGLFLPLMACRTIVM